MNKPNPLVPQGTFADKGKHHIRITVFAILAVHVMLLGVLLIAGCDKKGTETAGTDPVVPTTPVPPPPEPWPGTPTANPATSVLAGATGPTVPPSLTPSNPPIHVELPPPPPPPVPSSTEHTVVKGDSFYTLGKKYGVSQKAIAAENPGVDSTKLKLGQKLKIPPPRTATGGATPAVGSTTIASAGDGGDKTYSVKSGDNLTKIAKATGTTIRELRAANNIKFDKLKVGQKLKIPGKAPFPVEATSLPPSLPADPTLPPPGFVPMTNR